MKAAFIYSPWCTAGYKFNFSEDIYSNPRGLTGSEYSFISIARVLQSRGHDISIFMDTTHGPMEWNGIHIIPLEHIQDQVNTSNNYDFAISWNEPNYLRFISWKIIRLCNLQINSFEHCLPDYDDFVDIWTSPSESHRQNVGVLTPHFNKWRVLHNGCDPSSYDTSNKIPGRVIWASSPDRGLHNLLSIWPNVIEAVPHAELHIFYKIKNWLDHFVDVNPGYHYTYAESSNRAKYIIECFKRFKKNAKMNVHLHDSVSRNRIREEFNKAEVLAYPCETMSYTEGFSVSIMEACASGTVPIITNQDALGELYGGSVQMIETPFGGKEKIYSDMIIETLKNKETRDKYSNLGMELSKQYTWEKISSDLEKIVLDAKKERGWA